MFLKDLPKEHPLRNQPVAGFYHRWHCWQGQDITIAHEERDKDWQWWGACAWKLIPIPIEGKNPMPIAHMSYNELEEAGEFWTKDSDWATEKLPKRKKGELKNECRRLENRSC